MRRFIISALGLITVLALLSCSRGTFSSSGENFLSSQSSSTPGCGLTDAEFSTLSPENYHLYTPLSRSERTVYYTDVVRYRELDVPLRVEVFTTSEAKDNFSIWHLGETSCIYSQRTAEPIVSKIFERNLLTGEDRTLFELGPGHNADYRGGNDNYIVWIEAMEAYPTFGDWAGGTLHLLNTQTLEDRVIFQYSLEEGLEANIFGNHCMFEGDNIYFEVVERQQTGPDTLSLYTYSVQTGDLQKAVHQATLPFYYQGELYWEKYDEQANLIRLVNHRSTLELALQPGCATFLSPNLLFDKWLLLSDTLNVPTMDSAMEKLLDTYHPTEYETAGGYAIRYYDGEKLTPILATYEMIGRPVSDGRVIAWSCRETLRYYDVAAARVVELDQYELPEVCHYTPYLLDGRILYFDKPGRPYYVVYY